MPKHKDGEIDHEVIMEFFKKAKMYGPKVIIEKVNAIFGNSAKSMNTFGMRNGYIIALCHVYFGREIQQVTPRKWQKWLTEYTGIDEAFFSDGKRDTKLTTIRSLLKLYPSEDFRKNNRCRILHDGICDAVGIALYGVKNADK